MRRNDPERPVDIPEQHRHVVAVCPACGMDILDGEECFRVDPWGKNQLYCSHCVLSTIAEWEG